MGSYRLTPALQRLRERSTVTDSGCWEWQGKRAKLGYARIYFRGLERSGHRVAWESVHGPIPLETPVVRHSCDNPPCVNPDHLIVGTQADNLRDMVERGRHGSTVKTHCKRGHPFTAERTRIYRGRRTCRECERERSQARVMAGTHESGQPLIIGKVG